MDEEGCSSETFNVIDGIPDDACVPEDEASDNPESWTPPGPPYAPDSPESIFACLTIHQYYRTNVFDVITEHPKWKGDNDIDLREIDTERWMRILARARTSIHLKRCPAPNPISMDQVHLDVVKNPRSEYGEYVVTPKADGTRYQLLLTYGRPEFIGGNTEPMALLIDRRMDCYSVRVEAPDTAFKGTLLDGEIVVVSNHNARERGSEGEESERKSRRTEGGGQPTFLVIDFVAAAGNSEFSRMSLDRRIVAASKAIKSIAMFGTRESKVSAAPARATASSVEEEERIPLVVKEYFPVSRAFDLFEDPEGMVPYKTDGVIFVSKDLQIAKFTCPVAFKVKHHHTIDLLLVAEPCRDSMGHLVKIEEDPQESQDQQQGRGVDQQHLAKGSRVKNTGSSAFSGGDKGGGSRYKHTGDTVYRQTMIEQRKISMDAEARTLSSRGGGGGGAAAGRRVFGSGARAGSGAGSGLACASPGDTTASVLNHSAGRMDSAASVEREEQKRRRMSAKEEKVEEEKKKAQEKIQRMSSFMKRLKSSAPAAAAAAAPTSRPPPSASSSRLRVSQHAGHSEPSTGTSQPSCMSSEHASTLSSSKDEKQPGRLQEGCTRAPPPPPPAPPLPPPAAPLPPPTPPLPPPAPAQQMIANSSRSAEEDKRLKKKMKFKWLIKLMFLVGDRLQDAATGLEMKDDILTFRLEKNDKLDEILDRFDAAWNNISNATHASRSFVPVSLKCVVECICKYEPSQSRVVCEIERIRRDKKEPNAYSVIVGTLLSMNAGVTRADLEKMCKPTI